MNNDNDQMIVLMTIMSEFCDYYYNNRLKVINFMLLTSSYVTMPCSTVFRRKRECKFINTFFLVSYYYYLYL